MPELIPYESIAPDSPALITATDTITYRQLKNNVNNCIGQLMSLGVMPGDRAAVLSANSAEYITTLLALWSVKAVACPINVRIPPEKCALQLEQINARHLIVPDQDYDLIDTRVHRLRLEELTQSTSAASENVPLINTEDDATIIFTTGSSSQPKAVLHSLYNHMASALSSQEIFTVKPHDRWLLSLPLYHVGGLSIVFRALCQGAAIVISGSQIEGFELIKGGGITHLSCVAVQLLRLLDDADCRNALSRAKAILVGGSIIPEQLLKRAQKARWPVYTTYGLTEMSSQVATGKYPQTARILSHGEVKIAADGEILVKGMKLFKGYVDHLQIDRSLDQNGWFHTGDLGRLSDDGGLFVFGRKDNLFMSGGENIQPEEIEHYLCQMKSIERAIVVPTAHPEFTFRPAGIIKTRNYAPINREVIASFLGKHLPRYKIPDHFFLWPDSIDDRTMKIDRKLLSGQIIGHQLHLQEIR